MTVNITTPPPNVISISTTGTSPTSGGTLSVQPDTGHSEVYTFTFQGPLENYTGTGRQYIDFPAEIQSVRFSVGDTSPSSTTFDVKRNGLTSIFDSAFVLAASTDTLYRSVGWSSSQYLSRGDYLTVDIISSSLTQPAADLTVMIRVRRLS